jgi:rare lipoprotein A (peptidoglycan hydrolase)
MPIRTSTATTLFAAIAVTVLTLLPTAGALAQSSPGGAAAPAPQPQPPTATPAKHKIRPSGIATWFGPGFYGKETACGQTLTPGVVGVANRTLPCGTLVKVTYNGHALTVPVLDRGPYSHIGADWDLTSGAAEALGISETVRIRTAIVGRAPNTPTLGLPATPPSAVTAGGAVAG